MASSLFLNQERFAAMTASPLIQLHDAEVRRSGKTILHIGDFSLDQGQSIALLGPNGSGKSTFVKLITREIVPLYRDRAPVLFQGTDRIVLTEVHKQLGIVSSSMQDQMTVHLPAVEIVEGGLFGTLGLPAHITPTEETRQAARRALRRLHIEELADRDILTLSTGQARRVLIARALVHDPRTLIFDEPCTGLDPQGMHQVRAAMSELAAEGKGIVLVTHYLEDIVPEIETVALLKEGRLVSCGPKESLLTDRAISDLFDAPFIVTKTVMPAVRREKQGKDGVAESSRIHSRTDNSPSKIGESLGASQKPARVVFSLSSIY